MENIEQFLPIYKPKNDEHHWSPGELYPRDRQPDALQALERNARAAEEAIKREQIAAARRLRSAA